MKRQYFALVIIGLLALARLAPAGHPVPQLDIQQKDLRAQIQARLKEERTQLAGIKSVMSAKPRLARDDYIRLGTAIAERFLRRVETSGPDGKQSLDWSLLQVNELKEVLDQTEARVKEMAARRLRPQGVPRPAGGPVTVRDGIFYSGAAFGKGSPAVQRPFYFAGYGVFTQVAADLPNFRDLGVTVASQERGPVSMNSDGSLNDTGRSILDTLNSAAANGIKLDLLLSPHYFPQWAINQAPDVIPSTPAGSPNIVIDHPKAREVIQKWLEAIVSATKDKPALFSLCLANEPHNLGGGRDPYSRPRWIEYLRQQHPTIESLNALYGTNYASFEEVPPGTQAITDLGSKRAYYDWLRFNQNHFADWFRWMNDIIKGLAPDMPTHIKVLSSIFFSRFPDHGVDPELMCRVTDLAGNDAIVQDPDPMGFWGLLKAVEFWYDLLHSFRGQPTFNSENHFIPDDSPAVSLPPNHTRSLLWQGALHHEGATTLWVWEEPAVPWLAGSIYLRPANLYAAGRTMLDLNRLSPEVAALSQAKPKVALLYSMTSYSWGRAEYLKGGPYQDYLGVMRRVYAALTLLGQPVTFVSERQLAEGSAAKVDWIIIPHATHVPDATIAALEKFAAKGGRVVMANPDCLRWDEYQRERTLPQKLSTAPRIDATTDDDQVMANLRPVLMNGGLKLTPLRNVGDGKLAWGVEYRVVPYRGGTLVPMINFLKQPQNVRLSLPGSATDLLSDETVPLDQIRLEPMQPRLLRMRQQP